MLMSVLSFGQSTYKKADRLFEKMWYVEAAEEYEKKIDLGDRSIEVLQKAGDAYYFNTDMEGANKWYDILISEHLDEVDPEYIFRFVHSLEGMGKHKLAKKWMKEFSKRVSKDDPRSEKYSQNSITIEDILKIEPQFTLKNLSINTKNSDFGPMYFNNKLVYASAIDTSYYHKRTYNWNEQPFLDFQLGRITATDEDVEYLTNFSKKINTKYHEATLAFSPDEKTVYFTRNNYNGKLKRDQKGVNHLSLYRAKISDTINGKSNWKQIEALPFNSPDYSVGHPTVSEDGKQLYFVSDMPGSIGGTDIFVVDILENNTYSEPRNLGTKVNTHGREMFPYITDEKLYFASDGHLGLGGLDVFESEINTGFETPVNLGAPLNSTLDDFAFITDEENNIGFVCSNRPGGKGDDDIYSFKRFTPKEAVMADKDCEQLVKGYVLNNKTGERISDASVTLFSKTGEKLVETLSKPNGDYAFNYDLDCDQRYEIKVTKLGYNNNDKLFVTSAITKETIVPLEMETVNELIVEDMGLLKIKIGIIYFDLDKYSIRNDSAIELNKIVLLMNQYPNMVINVESHTDSRSPDDYNLQLSNNRAQLTKEYIVSQGIASERILSAIGYGETRLVNNCSNGVKCSESQHQLNRRSEFIIVKM